MGELDDALADLRSEALAATSGDFERVRAARRSYVARRATAAALAVALVVGGGAIAFASSGFLGADRNRDGVLVNPTPTATPMPTPSPEATGTGGGPLPTTLDQQPFQSSALAWDATNSELLLLGSRCLEYECVVEVRSFDNHTSSTVTPISRGFIDPEGNSTAASHFVGDLAVIDGTVYAYGPSLFVRQGTRWVEQQVDGSVTGLLSGPSGEAVAVVSTCKDTAHATGCALSFHNLRSGRFERLASFDGLTGSEYVTELGGSSDQLVLVLADNSVTRQLRGPYTHLVPGGNPCTGSITASVASRGSTFLELCNGATDSGPQTLYRSIDGGVSWTALGAPAPGGAWGRLVWPGCPAFPSTVLDLPAGGTLRVSDDEGSTWRAIPEVGGTGEQQHMLATCAGDALRVFVDAGNGSPLSVWSSRDGLKWVQTPVE